MRTLIKKQSKNIKINQVIFH